MTKREKADLENPEWTEREFKQAIAFTGLPESLQQKLSVRRREPGKTAPKKLVSIRLSSDVVDQLRATGPGWQTRANDALRDWLKKKRHAG